LISENIQTPDYKKARVLVIGDVMLDQFWQGDIHRISPEAPVPVLNYQHSDHRPGGAANVALNLAVLGVQTTLIGVIGNDDNGHRLHTLMTEANIDFIPCYSDKPTICKTRMMSQHQQLLRVDYEHLPNTSPQMLNAFQHIIDDFDYVVASDYGKGALCDIGTIIEKVNSSGKKILIDPKGQDFSKYQHAYLITPNRAELQQIVGEACDEYELNQSAETLLKSLDLSALLLTRSEAGMTLFTKQHNKILPFSFSTKAKEVFDVTGAGDTVIAVLSASLAAGSSLHEAVEIANFAAGIVVGKTGTASVTRREIDKALNEPRFIRQGFVTEQQLLRELQVAKSKGESIVMTNGCFDILHTGHVNYLSQAAKLGDRLLVAINTDESVSRLKGTERPANPLKSRAQVLAALRVVDWVVAFSENTPLRIIKACNPDFLVKGGDNDANTIPGAQSVRENGGQVLIMDYIEGFSTSKTIDRIKQQQ